MRTSHVSANEPPPFNPLAALQSLLSADVVSLKQRVKAAQQLAEYFRLLTPTPGLLLSYEPYLPLLADMMVTPVKGGQELQSNVLNMLQTLARHNPAGFCDWIARNTQMGNEPWMVQWSYALLLQVEKTVTRQEDKWDESTEEFKEFDRVFARVLQMWRTLLDHTAEVALVDQLVKYLQALLVQEEEQWTTLMLKKLQTHFVDIADVLIGWMMSTGPNSLLREEILTLLQCFGRLWADNSVFSLQLLNSFADEIVNLCDSWNEHQEGDDDRLSTLLSCFMMVAQCVPELALPTNEAVESPFLRVLFRVESCPQPEYSLFCVASCSEYLVSISNARRANFPLISVAAVRFLLYHCAMQSRAHNSEVEKILMVLKNASKLASANFTCIDDPLLVQATAVSTLEDDIPTRIMKKGSQSRRVKIMECLYHLKCPNGVAYLSRLCLQLTRLGGMGALKILGMQALQRLNGRNGEKENSFFVFAATCFILASRKFQSRDCDEDSTQPVALLELVIARLEKQSHRNRQHKLTPRQLCLVLKMSSACIGTASRCFSGRENVDAIKSVSLRILECAINLLSTDMVTIHDYRLGLEMLKVIDAVSSHTKLVPEIPLEVYQSVVNAVDKFAHCSCVKVREGCAQVLKTLHSRPDTGDFARNMFGVSLDLVLDPCRAVQDKVMSDVLSGMSRCALLAQERLDTPRHVSHILHPSFVAADFENIMSLFYSRECDGSVWNRVCRRIMDRVSPDVTLSFSDILSGAVWQAAAWCVQNRLRTHFGGPAQSFASIERLLLEYSDGVQGLSGWTYQHREVDDNISSAPSFLLTKWMLLEFMNALESGVTHAICTTDEGLRNPESETYKTVIFFRTNKVVCDDWLNRIRPLLLDMASNESSYELCRYHSHALATICYSKLTRIMTSFTPRRLSEKVCMELMQVEKDLDIALHLLCRCHNDAKDPDSIIGFQKWGESVSSSLINWYQLNDAGMSTEKGQCNLPFFRWMKAVRHEAEMRYEDAVIEYETLLEPMLESIHSKFLSSQGINTTQLFESPMLYLRLAPPVLLECFKSCAKCYAALRQWTKLRQFMSTFVSIARSLADCDRPIEGIQALFDCSDKWSEEIETIGTLDEAVSASTDECTTANEIESNLKKRAASAMRLWNVFSRSRDEPINDISHAAHIGLRRLKHDLIPLALQPTPWNGYAGEKVGKKAEETFLRISEYSKKTQSPMGMHHFEVLTEDFKLNSELWDSTLWSSSFCTPSLGGLTRDQRTGSADADCLHIARVARLARKQHNFNFARSLLTEAAVVQGVKSVFSMAVSYEKVKLFETIGMEDEGRRLLVAQCQANLSSSGIGLDSNSTGQKSITVQSLLHLAATFSKADDTELLSPATTRFLNGPLEVLSASCDQDHKLMEMALSANFQDTASHKCLQAAANVSPTSSKAWIRYSDWCYDRGKREIAQVTEQNGYISLNPSEESEMGLLLDKIGIAELDRDSAIRAFCRFLDNGDLIRQREDIFRRVCVDQAPPNHDTNAVDCLVQLQRECHSNILRFYVMATRGYGRLLVALHSGGDSSASTQRITMVALRLLGLLTTYGAERYVISALEDVFSTGPVAPWSYVVPQLIARAHHPVVAVSSLVCLILKRLAHHSPHSIVYPAVVDSMEPQGSISKGYEEQGYARNTLAAVLQELQNVSSGQVEGVRLLVSELRRISILWDEAWISMLMKLSSDVARRTSTLEKEATRVEKNVSLSIKEKGELAHRKLVAIMKPILVSIEKLWKETCGGARDQRNVSPHERKFLKEYGGLIETALENFRDCCSSEQWEIRTSGANTPQGLWEPFADILKLVISATGRRDQLPLHDISPAMASTSRQLALTNMPGAFSGKNEPITIHRVALSVVILRTKTKPKSLELIGSDGQTYKYLLKAREDLRLDERIMQFLRVTNDFLRADDAAAARDLSAKNYSVIPLSRDAGLIQMVPDVISLFQVYTSRNEQVAIGGRPAQDSTASSSVQQQPPPPTAQFYTKLKQHGIANVAPNHRAQWSIPILKQVYQELVAQRPRNVLQQEILLRSEDLRESWMKSARLVKSLAVMSVLGYIVGLGDRHLDNILLCYNSGDIVHIDHNVCFDKGRRLKVPEVLPFRLTPMLQDALGFTGVEGRFRVAFEITLRVIRSDEVREALLTLFEAFVYSPLVDWIAEDKRQGRSGDLKARLEVNVNLSLFLSRAEERRQDTVLFGRQYEQFVDIISQVVRGGEVPFAGLLGQRKRLVSLESEEQLLVKTISRVKSDLSDLQSAQQANRANVDAVAAQAKEISAKINSFVDECWARHRQIETWRQTCIAFAETDPETPLNVAIPAVESMGFQRVHATLGKVLAESQFACQYGELFDALEAKCQLVDRDVTRLRFEIERLATCLIPYLTSYGHWRKELDAYLDSELMANKDVYFTWWKRCSEFLGGSMGDHNEEDVSTMTYLSAVPSEESVAESTSILCRLNRLNISSSPHQKCSNSSGEVCEKSSLCSRADQYLQDIWNELSAMKLSNAQGQRLMKLAGASWIIETMGELTNGRINADIGDGDAFTPDLTIPPRFQFLVSVSRASTMLLELASTPKGSMKRLRADDLLDAIHGKDQTETHNDAGKGLNGFIDILESVRSFAATFQEELISNLHCRQPERVQLELLELMEAAMATSSGMQNLVNMTGISSSAAVTGDGSSLERLLTEHPAVRNVIAAAFAVLKKISLFVGSLQEVANEGIELIKSTATASWMELVLSLIKPYNTTEVDQPKDLTEQTVRAIWSARLDSFTSSSLVQLLRCQLSSVISSEWKFDFSALKHEPLTAGSDLKSDSLRSAWTAFYSSEIPGIQPSTLSLTTEKLDIQAGNVCQSVTKLTNVCTAWWTQEWIETQSNSWTQRINVLRRKHERRLQYASWIAIQPTSAIDVVHAPSLSQVQLLTFLSSQVPYLNALLTDQVTVEADVLELAQQMDYVASNSSATLHIDQPPSNENLHAYIQHCYGEVVAMFDYGRTLADLVQGISVIETSSNELMPEAAQMKLEVNIVGRSLLQQATEATSRLHSSSKAVDDLNTSVFALEDEMKQKQAAYDGLKSTKSSAEFEFRRLCIEYKDATMETARVLVKYVKEMRYLLVGFDKFKTPSKQNQAGATIMGSEGVRRQRQLQTEQRDSLSSGRSSPTVMPGYTFMENDRLVNILLRSIRSVNHLQQLEVVLERHGEICGALREAVDQIDQALRKFDADADEQLTVGGGQEESPEAFFILLLELVEALHVIESEPQLSSEGVPVVNTPNELPVSLLERGRDLVRGCVKLFFEATEMADRFSRAGDGNGQGSGETSPLDEDDEEEEHHETENDSLTPLALESGDSVALAVGSGGGGSSHDTFVNSPPSVEKKSQYGLRVLKRIEEKLSGTVTEMTDAPPVLTVEQQASWLIDEATKTDNLCVMYEGWTPWI